MVTFSTTDDTDYTDCCKSLRSCEAAEPNALSTIIQQPSTFYSHADLTNLTKDALLRAHRPPGWLLFQPQMTRITQIIANRDALAGGKAEWHSTF